MASLHILKGANPGQWISLNAEKFVLGRNPDCDIVIVSTAVSRAHAHILCTQGKYFIEDLRSRNKTYINNQELAPETRVPLKDNDRIKICDFLCTFHEKPALRPLPADLLPPQPEDADEEPSGSTTVEASLSSAGSHILLETQPAEKLKALLEISGFLSRTLEVEPLLTRIVESLIQLFRQADRVFVILRDETRQTLVPKVIRTRRPNDDVTARFSRRIVNMCLDNSQALLSDDATGDSRFGMSQSIADFRIRSVMCAPLTQEGKAFGVIQLDTQDRSKKFNQDDLALLMGVATQASIALDNAKLHEETLARARTKQELELAREVQRRFMPLRPPEIAGYEFYSYYESAQEVGGDYFDFIPLSHERHVAILGDVAGKGVPAALLMAKISALARFWMLSEVSPESAITKLNAELHQAQLTDRFVTLAAAQVDPKDHSVILVNAGHPSPLLYRRSTMRVEEAMPNEISGLPVGVLDGQLYQSHHIALEPGDCIVIFSDGVTDAMDLKGKQLQVAGIRAAVDGQLLSPSALGGRIVEAVRLHATGRSQHDDIALVCFGRT